MYARLLYFAAYMLLPAAYSNAAEGPLQGIPAFDDYVGQYTGEILNGGTYDTIESVFSLTPDGRLSGTYTIHDETGSFNGTISNVRLEGPRTISFEWTDKDGEGFAQLNFTQDYRSFSGYWGVHSSEQLYPWYGKR